jgi:two-component system, OmpR family, response regulator
MVRMAAVCRRQPQTVCVLTAGDLRFDRVQALVTVAGKRIALTASEYKVLEYLLLHKGRTVTREEVSEMLHGTEEIKSNTIEVFISRLRKKTGATTSSTFRIVSVWGEGYRLEVL